MMYSAGAMLALMGFLILAIGGVLLAFRIYSGRAVDSDHPKS